MKPAKKGDSPVYARTIVGFYKLDQDVAYRETYINYMVVKRVVFSVISVRKGNTS